MEFDFKRVLGYVLLSIGLFLIFYSIYLAYTVFMGISEPPKVYTEPSDNLDIMKAKEPSGEQITQKIDIPYGFFEKSINLSSFGILLFLFITAGGKLTDIGIRLTT